MVQSELNPSAKEFISIGGWKLLSLAGGVAVKFQLEEACLAPHNPEKCCHSGQCFPWVEAYQQVKSMVQVTDTNGGTKGSQTDDWYDPSFESFPQCGLYLNSGGECLRGDHWAAGNCDHPPGSDCFDWENLDCGCKECQSTDDEDQFEEDYEVLVEGFSDLPSTWHDSSEDEQVRVREAEYYYYSGDDYWVGSDDHTDLEFSPSYECGYREEFEEHNSENDEPSGTDFYDGYSGDSEEQEFYYDDMEESVYF